MITILSLILMIGTLSRLAYLGNKYQSISEKVKKGYNCYSCKDDIEQSTEHYLNVFLKELDKEEPYTLCKSCQRDNKLNIITNTKFRKDNIKLFLYKNNRTIIKVALAFMILFLIIDWTTFYITSKNPGISAYYNSLYWIYTAYNQEISFKRKNSL